MWNQIKKFLKYAWHNQDGHTKWIKIGGFKTKRPHVHSRAASNVKKAVKYATSGSTRRKTHKDWKRKLGKVEQRKSFKNLLG